MAAILQSTFKHSFVIEDIHHFFHISLNLISKSNLKYISIVSYYVMDFKLATNQYLNQ